MKGKLPNDWIRTTIGDLGKVVAGGTPSTREKIYWNGDIAWLTPADLSGYNAKFISSGKRNISQEGLQNSSAKLMPEGSVLFSSRAPIGYVAIASGPISTNQGFKNLVPEEKIVFNEYVFYYLKFGKHIAEEFASGTTFKEISGKSFSKIPIPLPPLPEQRRIVAKIEELFSELDAGVASLKKAKEQLKTYRQAVLKAAFEGKLIEADFDPTTLGTCGQLARGKSKHRPRNDPKLFNGKYPFIQTGDVRSSNGGRITKYQKCYSELGLSQSKLWPAGTLCITIAANIAETGFLFFDACFPDSVVGFIPNEGINIRYINYYLMFFRERLEEIAPATAQKNINLSILDKVSVPMTNAVAQEKIVEEIESRLSVCDNLEQTIEQELKQSESLRQSILKRAFEGRLV